MTMVRQQIAGICIMLGELIRETRRYYVYRSNPAPGIDYECRIEKLGTARSLTIHLQPCPDCIDYDNGSPR